MEFCQVMIWQVGSWQELMSVHMNEPIRRTQLSPDGRYLVVWERSVRKVTQLPLLWKSPRPWPVPTLAEFDAETEHGQPTIKLR